MGRVPSRPNPKAKTPPGTPSVTPRPPRESSKTPPWARAQFQERQQKRLEEIQDRSSEVTTTKIFSPSWRRGRGLDFDTPLTFTETHHVRPDEWDEPAEIVTVRKFGELMSTRKINTDLMRAIDRELSKADKQLAAPPEISPFTVRYDAAGLFFGRIALDEGNTGAMQSIPYDSMTLQEIANDLGLNVLKDELEGCSLNRIEIHFDEADTVHFRLHLDPHHYTLNHGKGSKDHLFMDLFHGKIFRSRLNEKGRLSFPVYPKHGVHLWEQFAAAAVTINEIYRAHRGHTKRKAEAEKSAIAYPANAKVIPVASSSRRNAGEPRVTWHKSPSDFRAENTKLDPNDPAHLATWGLGPAKVEVKEKTPLLSPTERSAVFWTGLSMTTAFFGLLMNYLFF